MRASYIHHKKKAATAAGFTLLEVLVALAILSLVFTLVWQTFSSTTTAWEKGSEALSGLHHGDFLMEQFVTSLRSAAYFDSSPEKYGFRLESKQAGRYPTDVISWVTASPAFLPGTHPMARSVHRLEISVENIKYGEKGVVARAFSHFAEEEDIDAEWMPVSTEVKGVDCRVFVQETPDEDGSWEDDWEFTNKVPGLVHISLYLDPVDKKRGPRVLERLIRIPAGVPVTGTVEPDELKSR